MRERSFMSFLQHPAVALVCATFFGLAAVVLIHAAIDIGRQLSADDPVQIADRALARSFNREIAEREIRSALTTGDINLAQSFVELAGSANVSIDAALTDQVQKVTADQSSGINMAARFVHGFWTGEPTDLASLAGTAARLCAGSRHQDSGPVCRKYRSHQI
jgi:hypothetical protein